MFTIIFNRNVTEKLSSQNIFSHHWTSVSAQPCEAGNRQLYLFAFTLYGDSDYHLVKAASQLVHKEIICV